MVIDACRCFKRFMMFSGTCREALHIETRGMAGFEPNLSEKPAAN
jgi:hypothetical protein